MQDPNSKPETTDDMRQRIASLLEQEAVHNAALRELRSERSDLEMALTKMLSGIDVGSLVRHRKYGECRVVSIERRFLPTATPWVRANNRKKDGNWSDRELHLFSDWKVL